VTTQRVSDSMGCAAAEVVVRFGETIVTSALVTPNHKFVIGPTRGVDLALEVAAFTLVESTERGFVTHTGADTRPVPLVEPIEFAIGQVTIRVAPVTQRPAPVPRLEVQRRPLAFGAGSLFAHIGLLVVAGWLADPTNDAIAADRDGKNRPARIARFSLEAQTVKREDKPPPATVPITTDETPAPNPALDELAYAATAAAASVELNGLGEAILDPSVESAESSGDDPTTFDPDANPTFDTVKVGNFSTVATGASAGAQYKLAGENGQRKPVIIVSCDSSSCLILGGDPKSGVREALEAKLDQIVGCYEKYESTAGKKVELDFGIDAAGKIDAVNVGGVGDYDSCVANVIKSLEL